MERKKEQILSVDGVVINVTQTFTRIKEDNDLQTLLKLLKTTLSKELTKETLFFNAGYMELITSLSGETEVEDLTTYPEEVV